MAVRASDDIQRIVALSNQVVEYPPCKLNKMQFQALLVLISYIDSTQKPVYGIDDVKDEIVTKGITDKMEQMRYIEELITEQNTFRIPFREYAKYFTEGNVPRGGIINRALDAALSLNNRTIEFNNPKFQGGFVWFQAVYRDKETDDLTFVITSFIKPFLMGLRRDFLQMLAESTMDFDGKHSIPIFLYMKSRLYDGQKEFHAKEPLDNFRKRFGLDKISTYDDFGQLRRRVLDKATEDSLKSGDIKFFFEGKSSKGSKKITDLYYSIYRTGVIKKIVIGNRPERRSIIHKEQLSKLTRSQLMTYNYLTEKGVNKTFIVEKILQHPKLQYEPIEGFEDIFIKILWEYFERKTKATRKAGAFVSWWKRGRLTEDALHAKIMQGVIIKKKAMSQEILDNRLLAKSISHIEFEEQYKTTKQQSFSKSTKKSNFTKEHIKKYKQKCPKEYQRIYQSILLEYQKTFDKAGQVFDENKHKTAIENRVVLKLMQKDVLGI